jgi:predicted N-acetyltransferase YhbS
MPSPTASVPSIALNSSIQQQAHTGENMSTAAVHPGVTVRRAKPSDAEVCGTICYEAFAKLNRRHSFPPDLPSPEVGVHLMSMMFSHPGFFCVVAEKEGKIVGSNCLDERSVIAGVGPITIDPAAQDAGIGRTLMLAVMDRAAERRSPGVRLVQAAFHGRSMSLYAKLGFDIREPLVVMQGAPIRHVPAGYVVRVATPSDLESCNALCRRVHGHDRSGELSDAIGQGKARVVERDGRIVG